MYGKVVLFVLAALAASGLAYWSVLDNTKADLVVTTHNPGCTAIFMLDYNVTRQSELRPTHLYSFEEMRNGLNMTFGTYADEAARLVPLLANRGEISSVAAYSAGPTPKLLAHDTNPDIDTNPYTGTIQLCDVLREPLLGAAVDALLADSEGASRSAGASGSSSNQNLVPITLNTYRLAETLAYLKENDAINIRALESREGDGWGSIDATVPYTLLVPLYKMDHIPYMRESGNDVAYHDNYGSIDTEGKWGTNIDAWHNAGYKGAGIKAGVIDSGFMGFDGTDELPDNVSFYCFSSTGAVSQTDERFCYGNSRHGTAAAEILMDVAPEANLYISRIDNSMQINEAVRWMTDPRIGQGVDIIVMSLAMLFEGPGDGNEMNSALDAVDKAVSEGIVWVNSAGNYGEGWSVRDPQTHDNLIVFDTNNDTTNQFGASAGERVSVWLRWHDADNANTDLNLFVSNGATHHIGRIDQWGGTSGIPSEMVSFVPANDGRWDISLAVIGTAVPDWIQLFAVGIDGKLEHYAESVLGNIEVDLVVTTHNPGCTAIFMLDYNVTRQSELRPTHLYSFEEMRNGLNMMFGTYADEAAKLVPLMADRGEISSVASYSAGPTPKLLAHDTNPDIDTNPYTGTIQLCDVLYEPLLGAAVDALLADSEGASGSSPNQNLVRITLDTYRLAETLAYLKENGAINIRALESREGDGWGSISATVPYTLLVPLYKMDHISYMSETGNDVAYHDNYGQ